MYRFRPISSLLDKFNELENQEIYFAAPNELNDPMEGFKDIFWKGDEIIWRNFIINYIKAVQHYFSLLILLGDEEKISDEHIVAEPHRLPYANSSIKGITEQVIEKVFNNKFISDLPKRVAQRASPVRREELASYLDSIHPFVINAVSDTHYQNDLIPKRFLYQNIEELSNLLTKNISIPDLINKIEIENPELSANHFFSVFNRTSQQIRLISKYNYPEKGLSSNSFFLATEFPERFLQKLEDSVYPDWYSASFLSDCSNSALWGYYGDNHKGVCLKYRTQSTGDKIEINLDVIYGASGGPDYTTDLKGMRPQEFYKVNYHNKHVEIDFFKSLARMNRGQLNAFWYSDKEGNLSACGNHFNDKQQEDKWRNNYWENFMKSFTVKLLEWEFEQEYRLMIHGNFQDYSTPDKRKLKYSFNDLEGIVFGIKTSVADKIRIMKIIENKCKLSNRKDFKFYQACYAKENGKIEMFELDFLKFE